MPQQALLPRFTSRIPAWLRLYRGRIRERAGDRGGTAGDVQSQVDVLQVATYGSLGNAESAGDLSVGVPGGEPAQQVLLPRGEPGSGTTEPFGVEVGLVHMRTQQREQLPVALGEVRARPAEEE